MNIYLISQDQNNGYDTYDSAVVTAPSEEVARNINPSSGNAMELKDWGDHCGVWCDDPKHVIVELIGSTPDDEVERVGLVLSSFNAG